MIPRASYLRNCFALSSVRSTSSPVQSDESYIYILTTQIVSKSVMAETLGVSVAATPEDGCVASIMRNMSWGASEAQPLSAAGQMPMPQMPMAMPTEDFGGNKDLMQELHMRAAREAALAVGMSPSAAMAAMPLLPTMPTGMIGVEPGCRPCDAEGVLGSEPLGMPSCSTSNDSCGQPEQLFTCTVCRKVFKREMNLIFHMTTHRPRQPEVEPTDSTSTQPVKCQDCGKEFATKYQAKKHFLRRHFQGEKPFACTKCNKKRFVVKEDLTMHMKVRGHCQPSLGEE